MLKPAKACAVLKPGASSPCTKLFWPQTPAQNHGTRVRLLKYGICFWGSQCYAKARGACPTDKGISSAVQCKFCTPSLTRWCDVCDYKIVADKKLKQHKQMKFPGLFFWETRCWAKTWNVSPMWRYSGTLLYFLVLLVHNGTFWESLCCAKARGVFPAHQGILATVLL